MQLKKTSLFLAIVVSQFAAIPVAAESHMWKSADGKNSIEAEFIDVQEDTLTLRKVDGKEIEVSLSKLDAQSQKRATGLSVQKKAVKPNSPKVKAGSARKNIRKIASIDGVFDEITLCDDGTVVFLVARDEHSRASELFRFSGGRLSRILGNGREGNGKKSNLTVSYVDRLSVSGDGQIAAIIDFRGEVGNAVWSEKNRQLKLIAKSGMHVSKHSESPIFELFHSVARDRSGRVFFLASLVRDVGSDPSVPKDEQFRIGVWLARVDGFDRLKYAETNRYGISDGAYLKTESDGKCYVVDGSNKALIHEDGILVPVQVKPPKSAEPPNLPKVGSQAPGCPTDARFDQIRDRDVLANTAGKFAFTASLKPDIGGVDSANNFGIWAINVNGDTQLICRTEAPIEFLSVDGINSRGQIAFSRRHDGTSTLFVSDAIAD